MKPTATLTIITCGPSTSYLLHDSTGKLLWNTRAYSTPEGTDGARERLRAWLVKHPHTIVLAKEGQAERRRA
jgi:hypothetical protein